MASRMESKQYAAVDIGASSGRVLAGWVEDGKMSYQEVYRFDNEQQLVNGHDCWDVEALFNHVVAGLRAVKEKTGTAPATIGIDTWGVDFVLLDEANKIVGDTLYLGVGREGEPYEGIGRGMVNIAGMPVYRDAEGGIGTPTTDHERTKLSLSTTHLLALVNGYDGNKAQVERCAQYIVQLTEQFACGREAQIAWY